MCKTNFTSWLLYCGERTPVEIEYEAGWGPWSI